MSFITLFPIRISSACPLIVLKSASFCHAPPRPPPVPCLLRYEGARRESTLTTRIVSLVVIFAEVIIYHGRLGELTARVDFLWKRQVRTGGHAQIGLAETRAKGGTLH